MFPTTLNSKNAEKYKNFKEFWVNELKNLKIAKNLTQLTFKNFLSKDSCDHSQTLR